MVKFVMPDNLSDETHYPNLNKTQTNAINSR